MSKNHKAEANKTSAAPGRPEDAAQDIFEWARIHPGEEEAWDAIDEAAREADSPHEAEGLYLRVLEQNLDKEVLSLVGRRAIAFLEEWYEDMRRAVEILSRLIEKDPENSWAFEKLSLLLTLAERWDDLLGTYDKALLQMGESALKLHLLEEAARIAKDFAGQAQRASDYLKQLLLLRPTDEKLAISLERRLEQQERFSDLVDIWRARLTVTRGDDNLALRVRIANTLFEPLRDAPAALIAAKELLADGVGQDAACDLAERLSQDEQIAVEPRREALAVLKARYLEMGRLEDVARVLRSALLLAPDDEVRIQLNKELVAALLSLNLAEEAQVSCAAWLRLAPDDGAALDQLRDLASRTSRYAAFSQALVAAGTAISEGILLGLDSNPAELRIRLLLEAADTQETRANDPREATELFARVLLDAESDRSSRLLSARRLTGLLTSPAQGGQRLDVLEKLSLLEPDEKTQVLVLGEAAELAERLGDPDRALTLWDRRLLKERGDKVALDAKVRVLSNNQRHEALQLTLRERFTHSTDETERRQDLVWIAAVFEEKLHAAAKAIDIWQEIEAHFGRDPETVDALSRLFSQVERWGELIEFLVEAVEEESDPRRRTRIFTTLGDVFREQRHSHGDAVKYYRLALDIEATHAEARAGLELLLSKEDAKHVAAETLAVAYRQADEWRNLLAIAETRLAAEPKITSKQAILLEAATLLETRAQEPKQSLGFVTRAFALIPEKDIEEKMQALALLTREWELAVGGYQQALLGCDDLVRTTELLYEQGRLLEVELTRLEEALSAYRRIVELDNLHVEAASALIRCAGAVDAWPQAAWGFVQSSLANQRVLPEVAESFASAADRQRAWSQALQAAKAEIDGRDPVDNKAGHAVRFQLAVWYRDRLEDFDIAELVLRRTVEHLRSVESLSALADLQRRHADRDFVETLLKLVAIHNDPLPYLDEAARVALTVVGDAVLARPILAQALELAETSIEESGNPAEREIASFCLEQLLRLAREGADYTAAFELLMRGSSMNLDAQMVLSLKHRAAETCAHELANPQRAIELCREVLSLDPARDSTTSLLATLYEQEAMHDELLTLREQELALTKRLPRRLELRLDMSRVQGIVGATPDARVLVLSENLKEQLGHAATIDALAEVLAPIGRFAQLCQLLCQQADLLSARGAAAEAALLYARAGLLAEETLDDVDGAIDAYRKATEHAPEVGVLDALSSIHSARGEFDEAVKCLLHRLSLTPDSDMEARRSATVRLGQALKRAERVAEAISHLTVGVKRDPAGQAVRDLLVALHEEQGHWAEFADLLASGVPYAQNKATKVQYLSRAADTLWHRLNQLDRAIPLLEQARDLLPEEQQLRLVLADALRHAMRYDEAREILEGLLAEFGRRRTPERATVHFQLALIARATRQLDQALNELEAASTIQRSDPLILKTLGDVAREKGELERAERAYRALLLLVGRGPAAESGIGESAILFELYRLAVERKDEERAKDLLDSALEAADQNPAEALRLEAALADAARWELLLDALERRGQRTVGNAQEQRSIQSRRAEALAQLERFDEALELRLGLLDEDASDAKLLADTEALAERCGRIAAFNAKLAELAQRCAEAEPALACELWLRLGLAAEQRGDVAAAAGLYQRAEKTGQRAHEVFRALSRVYELTSDVAGLLAALEAFVATTSKDVSASDQIEASFRLAELLLRDKKRRKEGLERLDQVLSREPNYARGAQALLGAIEAGEPTKALLKSLEEVARKLGDQALLLRTLGFWVRREDTTLSQLQEAVQLAERLNDEAQVLALLERTVEFARAKGVLADVQWALSRLAECREQGGDFKGAVALLTEALRHADASERFELELRLATVARDGAKDLALAAEVYERLAEAEPSDARVWKPLLEIYRSAGETNKLEICLSRAEQHVIHDEQRRSLQLERIRLLIDADRLEEAEASLRDALEQTPDNDEACDLLLELLERQGKASEVRDLLSSRLQVTIDQGDEPRIAAFAMRLGALLEGTDTEGAMQIYRTARAAAPGSREVLAALLRLTPETETRERADLMESLLPTELPEGVEALALDLARLRLSSADEPGIERAFELGFKLNPKSLTLRERLETWYRERDDWLPLAELLALDASTRDEPREAIAQYMQAASIYETQLGDAGAAADVLGRALELNPIAPELLEPLSQYLLTSAQGDRAVSVLTEVLAHEQLTPEVKATVLHLRAAVRARMDENNLAGLVDAIADLDAAREAGGSDLDTDLCELLLRARELAQAHEDPEQERTVTLRLATLLPARGRAPETLSMLSSWTERYEDDKEANSKLAALALAEGDWVRSLAAHRRLFASSTGAERVEAALRFAEACEHCGAPMDARAVLETLHAEAPTSPEVGRRLYRMYEAAGAHAELAELLLVEAQTEESGERKYELLTNAAELLLKTKGQEDRAIEALEMALQIIPSDHRATVAISKAYGVNGRIAEACAVLEAAIKVHGKRRSRELSDLQHAMSVVAAAAGDDDGRFAWLEAALQSDRKNGEVAAELAIAAQQRGMLDEAVKALQLITLLKEEDCPMSRAEAYYRQAVIAVDRGDRKKGVLLAKRALSSDAGYQTAQTFLNELGEA